MHGTGTRWDARSSTTDNDCGSRGNVGRDRDVATRGCKESPELRIGDLGSFTVPLERRRHPIPARVGRIEAIHVALALGVRVAVLETPVQQLIRIWTLRHSRLEDRPDAVVHDVPAASVRRGTRARPRQDAVCIARRLPGGVVRGDNVGVNSQVDDDVSSRPASLGACEGQRERAADGHRLASMAAADELEAIPSRDHVAWLFKR